MLNILLCCLVTDAHANGRFKTAKHSDAELAISRLYCGVTNSPHRYSSKPR